MSLAKLVLEMPSELAEDAGQLLIEQGAGGVEEQACEGGARLIVYGSDAAELRRLGEAARAGLSELGADEQRGTLSVAVVLEPNSDWETAWTQHLTPQVVTPRWVVQPLWDETPPPDGMGCILIRPTLAFGDGGHATTRLAAQAVERFCLAVPDARVLDFGTGTGVLAIVAALSGARSVVGIDLDAVALAAAAENARLNGLDLLVRFEDAAPRSDAGFDLVVANLEPRTFYEHAPSIAASARGARELVVTGFLAEQVGSVLAAFAGLGFGLRSRVDEGEWSLLVLAAK